MTNTDISYLITFKSSKNMAAREPMCAIFELHRISPRRALLEVKRSATYSREGLIGTVERMLDAQRHIQAWKLNSTNDALEI